MSRPPQGWFRGLPFNWSTPSEEDVARSAWDPDDPRVITPKTYGWGYSINFAALFGRRRPASGDDQDPPQSDGAGPADHG